MGSLVCELFVHNFINMETVSITLLHFSVLLGFIKFLGPYYMLLITKRRQIGAICGHNIYAVCKSEIIPLSNSTAWANTVNSKIENR